MVYIHMPAFWVRAFSQKLVYRLVGFIRDEGAQIHNWMYFKQIIVKNTQFGQNWMVGAGNWKQFGIEKIKFSRSGRHIHIRLWQTDPNVHSVQCTL